MGKRAGAPYHMVRSRACGCRVRDSKNDAGSVYGKISMELEGRRIRVQECLANSLATQSLAGSSLVGYFDHHMHLTRGQRTSDALLSLVIRLQCFNFQA